MAILCTSKMWKWWIRQDRCCVLTEIMPVCCDKPHSLLHSSGRHSLYSPYGMHTFLHVMFSFFSSAPLLPICTNPLLCVAAFCKSMEQDAAERAQRRMEREKKGRDLKRAGNAAFKSSQYDIAVQQYTAAIESMPWDVSLYTNRAQVWLCGVCCMWVCRGCAVHLLCLAK